MDVDFLRLAYDTAVKHSDDPRTWVGAVITGDGLVVAAANQYYDQEHAPTHRVKYPERFQSPLKSHFIEHAERRAVYALVGHPATNLVMYAPWAACTDCARSIIYAGIGRLVVHRAALDRTPAKWHGNLDAAYTMLRDKRVEVEVWEGKIGDTLNMMDSEIWVP